MMEACLHPLLIFMMSYEDDIHPKILVPPAISEIHPEHRPEHLYQQKKLSAPGDGHI